MQEFVIFLTVCTFSLLTSSDFYNPYVPLKIAAAKRRKLLEVEKHFRSKEKPGDGALEPQGAHADTDGRNDASCGADELDGNREFADLRHSEDSDVIETRNIDSDVSLIRSSHCDLKGQEPVAHGCRSVEGKLWINVQRSKDHIKNVRASVAVSKASLAFLLNHRKPSEITGRKGERERVLPLISQPLFRFLFPFFRGEGWGGKQPIISEIVYESWPFCHHGNGSLTSTFVSYYPYICCSDQVLPAWIVCLVLRIVLM